MDVLEQLMIENDIFTFRTQDDGSCRKMDILVDEFKMKLVDPRGWEPVHDRNSAVK